MKAMRFAAPLVLALVAAPATAEDLVCLNTFPTARSLPFFVGVEKGLFAKHGIRLEFEFTGSSSAQRQGLANGKFEVVHSAVDNEVAMIEVAKVDVVTRSYDLIEPDFGLNPDARLSTEGFDNVLKLQQEVEGGLVPGPAKYLDLSYYNGALTRLAHQLSPRHGRT